MKQSKGIFIGLALLVVLAIVGLVVADSAKKTTKTNSGGADNTNKQVKTTSTSDGTTTKTDASAAVATKTVNIKDYMFDPMAITVKVGDTVTWTNQDSVHHNVVADTKSADAPDGPLLAKGESYSFTFKKAGTYSIHCEPHPYMKATITVTE